MLVLDKDMNKAALGEYALMGFRLEKLDDHFTGVYFKEHLIGMGTPFTTIENFRKMCKDYMDALNGGLDDTTRD